MADATRALKDRELRGDKGGDVAKLFAKHVKLDEHIAYLRRTKLAAAAGTPGRIGQLLECGTFPSLVSLCLSSGNRFPSCTRGRGIVVVCICPCVRGNRKTDPAS